MNVHAHNSAPPSVLLVDDDRATLELLGHALGLQGFDVSLAVTPEEAHRLLQTVTVDAVVTDVHFDGFEKGESVLIACRELQPSAVVILMTGYPEVQGAVSAIKGGALDYLVKPVDPVVLGAMVHRALRERTLEVDAGQLEFTEVVNILSEMVANTIERVDPYTAGHGERTRKYCKILAECFDLDTTETERLELGAIAHDYGKIYLEDLTFLTKAGPLTPDEYREVQKHPALGASKLGDNPYLQEVCQYVAEHHEKYDGTGYPHRLKGDEISLPGRILGVVEVFDSLSTKRSYKDVWPLDKTLDFFKAQRERAFDPAVLDAFTDLLEVHGEEWMAAPQTDLLAAGVIPAEDAE
ncbi:MAG: response regulator [Planctomycetes bacterium]|nr:response regulator [Planctomycetota bacterium]